MKQIWPAIEKVIIINHLSSEKLPASTRVRKIWNFFLHWVLDGMNIQMIDIRNKLNDQIFWLKGLVDDLCYYCSEDGWLKIKRTRTNILAVDYDGICTTWDGFLSVHASCEKNWMGSVSIPPLFHNFLIRWGLEFRKYITFRAKMDQIYNLLFETLIRSLKIVALDQKRERIIGRKKRRWLTRLIIIEHSNNTKELGEEQIGV